MTYRILVIDDQKNIHDDYRMVLESEPDSQDVNDALDSFFDTSSYSEKKEAPLAVSIDSAYQGKEGLDMLSEAIASKNPYAMAFVDMRMPPGWDGLETIKHLWEEDPQLQVVICTAYSDYTWNDLVDELGQRDNLLFLKKPFNSTEILQMALALTKKWELNNVALLKISQLNQMVKQQTATLNRSKLAAESGSRAKSLFLTNMSHEFRTPMNAILGFGQILQRTSEDFTENQKRSVRQILTAGEVLLHLINEILDLSAIESGKTKLEISNFYINDALKQCMSLIKPQADGRNIRLIDGYTKHREYKAWGDKIKVNQIILNFLSNAVKYGGDNGEITVETEMIGEDWLRISVSDSGKGLSKQQIDKLFVHFERLNANDEIEGSGIGLVICKKLTELMSGKIGIDSVVDKGSTFWIELKAGATKPDIQRRRY